DLQRVPEQRVGEHLLVVRRPDEGAGSHEVLVGEAEPDAAQRGHQVEGEEAERGGRDEHGGDGQVAPPADEPLGCGCCGGHRGIASIRRRAEWSGSSAGTCTPTSARTAPLSSRPVAHHVGWTRSSYGASEPGPAALTR